MPIKSAVQRMLAHTVARLPRSVFFSNDHWRIYERHGLHVSPNHFYFPIPDSRQLPADVWERSSAGIGIRFNAPTQLALLSEYANQFIPEYKALPDESQGDETHYYKELGFNRIDGAMLYSMVHRFRPQKIIEIGSGASTVLSATALLRNESEGAPPAELISIEPYPHDYLRQGFAGLTKLIEKPVQKVPFSEFEALNPNDILFIDSSHSIKIGGDVLYEFLEILPRLKPGVIVHVHDIFLPREYPQWVGERRTFWNEQYLLHAFLLHNDAWEILWCPGYLLSNHRRDLERVFADDWIKDENGAAAFGSFWMRRKAAN